MRHFPYRAGVPAKRAGTQQRRAAPRAQGQSSENQFSSVAWLSQTKSKKKNCCVETCFIKGVDATPPGCECGRLLDEPFEKSARFLCFSDLTSGPVSNLDVRRMGQSTSPAQGTISQRCSSVRRTSRGTLLSPVMSLNHRKRVFKRHAAAKPRSQLPA